MRKLWALQVRRFLTGSEEALHLQEAEGDSHDGRFVQVGGHSAGERQSASELIKHLRLLAPPTSGRITRTQLPLLRTGPTGGRKWTQDRINRDIYDYVLTAKTT